MLDLIDLGCPLLRTSFFEQAITTFGYFGHAAVGGTIGVALLAHGYLNNHERNKRAGIAIIAALIITGAVSEVSKHTIQMPRPRVRSSYGFPSGHTTTAFSLASTLAVTFPALSPLFFILAVLTGISRMYLRAHFTVDVIGGMIVGLVVSFPIAKKIIPEAGSCNRGVFGLLGWIIGLTLGVAGLAFFHSGEKNIAAYMHLPNTTANTPAIATFDFGTAQARASMKYGWSGDEKWEGDKRTVVWATGLASEIIIPLPTAQDYRFRMSAFPYSPKGPACQRVEVKVNDTVVAKVLLEQGWHEYEFRVPKSTVQAGPNTVQFFYDYAEPPKLRGKNLDERPLSVAFDTLQASAQN